MIYSSLIQMADPLTALIHAVQVMNFLKTLIIKTVKEREDSAAAARASSSNSGSSSDKDEPQELDHLDNPFICSSQEKVERPMISGATLDHFLFRVEEALHHDVQASIGEPKKHGRSVIGAKVGCCPPFPKYNFLLLGMLQPITRSSPIQLPLF
jgi:hypothetical protein